MFDSGPYYFATTRKYIAYFGCLFRNIWIDRTLPNGALAARFNVPIAYADKEKTLARLIQDSTANRDNEITLPAMSFAINSVQYDGGRHLSSVQRVTRIGQDPNKFATQYVPVPYNITFSLYIYVKNAEDGTKIIEQILPTFTPEFQARLELTDHFTMDVPVIIDTAEPYSAYKDETYQEHRAYIWTLTFTMKGYYFGPIKEVPIIKFEEIQYDGGVPGDSQRIMQVTFSPGLTSNGQPTTNAAASIDPLSIWVYDDWGITSVKE